MKEKVELIYNELSCSAKVNLAFGSVLQNVHEEDTFKYFYPADNNTIFPTPLLLSNFSDIAVIQNEIDRSEILESLISRRPDTKWIFHSVTNVSFFVYLLIDVPLACSQIHLPESLLRHKGIKCLLRDCNRKPYHDNLCLFRAVAFELSGSQNLATETFKLFESFINLTNQDLFNFPGVCSNQISIVENLVKCNIQLFEICYDESGTLCGQLSRRSAHTYQQTISLLQYDDHICWTDDIDTVLKRFRCLTCDHFFSRTKILLKHVPNCKENIKHVYPSGPYQLDSTIFERLQDVGIEVEAEHKMFQNLAVFDFESITVKDDQLCDTERTKWIGRHVPVSVSIASNLLQETVFLYNSDPFELVRSFLTTLVGLSNESSIHYRNLFRTQFDVLERRYQDLKNRLPSENDGEDLSETSNFLNSMAEAEDTAEEEEEDHELKTLRYEQRTLSKLRDDLKDYVETLPVFGFNSSRYDLNLIKEYLIDILLREYQCTPSVVQKCNQFLGFKCLGIQFLDILNFLGGTTSLDKFLKAYGCEESKGFFPYEWFDNVDKLSLNHLPPIDSFYSKLKNCNVLESDFREFERELRCGKSEHEVLKKLKLTSVPLTKEENYEKLQFIWREQNMTSFLDFLRWYNNKDVQPTLTAMIKMKSFYHNINIDMLKLGLTLPSLANRILHNSTSTKFFPFSKEDSFYDDYIREWLTGGPSIIFNRYAKVGETFLENTDNLCRAIVGIDASQLYPYAMTQQMPSGVYVKWEYCEQTNLFHPRRNKRSYFEQIVLQFIQKSRPECTIQTQFTSAKQKKIGRFAVDGYCAHCNTVFEAMGCFYHFCTCQERKNLLLEDIEKGLKRRERTEYRRDYIRNLGYQIEEIWECTWWTWVRENRNGAKKFMSENFPYVTSMREDQLVNKILREHFFGVVDCEVQVPDHLKEKFSKFPPIFKNCNVFLDDVGDHMLNFAMEKKIMTQPRRMLISSMKLQRGPLITPLLLFYLKHGLILKKIHFFLQYTPVKCFNSFVQSVVTARREGDKNKNSTVIAETMKLIGNSAYGYQIMDRSRHSRTKYVLGTAVDKLINNRFFQKLNELPRQIYEVELKKCRVVHKEPIIVGFFILQYAKLTMLQLVYEFFDKFCDPSKYEFIETDTDSLYLAISERTIPEIIRSDREDAWTSLRLADCRPDFEADGQYNFFPRECCPEHNHFDQRTPGLFKEEFRCTEMVALCSKTYCCLDETSGKVKISSKGINKNTLLNDTPMEKYLNVLLHQTEIETVNRGFRFIGKSKVCTYELKKNGLSYFYPKRKVKDDGIHTEPLDI